MCRIFEPGSIHIHHSCGLVNFALIAIVLSICGSGKYPSVILKQEMAYGTYHEANITAFSKRMGISIDRVIWLTSHWSIIFGMVQLVLLSAICQRMSEMSIIDLLQSLGAFWLYHVPTLYIISSQDGVLSVVVEDLRENLENVPSKNNATICVLWIPL